MSPIIEEIRKKISAEEFDYAALTDVLKDYERPRDKITVLLRQGFIVRVKKGIYIFGPGYARRPFSREILANMVYGPSYVSLDYALHYHGLIPERTEAVTSVTTGRGRRFATPVGLFIYRGIPLKAYPIGIHQITDDGGRSFLMAGPEKALADKIYADRGTELRNRKEMKEYLLQHLRIDPAGLEQMDAGVLAATAARYRSQKIRLLSRLAEKLTGGKKRHE